MIRRSIQPVKLVKCVTNDKERRDICVNMRLMMKCVIEIYNFILDT